LAANRLGREGFTLIEVMAVVVVIGIAMGLVLPNLTASRGAQLEQSARDVAVGLELARERAIVTGAAHRAFLDLDVGSVRIDWHVSEERAFEHLSEDGDDEPGGTEEDIIQGYSASAPISLSPPAKEERDYYPVPNRFGGEEWLPEDVFFEGVNTPEGWIEEGAVQIVFQSDGSTDYSEIFLTDVWANRVILEIHPLLEVIRIRRDQES